MENQASVTAKTEEFYLKRLNQPNLKHEWLETVPAWRQTNATQASFRLKLHTNQLSSFAIRIHDRFTRNCQGTSMLHQDHTLRNTLSQPNLNSRS